MSPSRLKPMTPSVIVPSTSRNSTRMGVASGASDATRGLLHRLVDAHGLVEERGGACERKLGGGIGERLVRIRMRFEEEPVDATGHGRAHEREREAAVAARLEPGPLPGIGPAPLQAVRRVVG